MNKRQFIIVLLCWMAGYVAAKYVFFDKGFEYFFILMMVLLFIYGFYLAELNRRLKGSRVYKIVEWRKRK